MAARKSILPPEYWTLTRDEITYLCDRLYSAGVSSLSTLTERERRDAITASRVITRLLQAYERAAGFPLVDITLGGAVL